MLKPEKKKILVSVSQLAFLSSKVIGKKKKRTQNSVLSKKRCGRSHLAGRSYVHLGSGRPEILEQNTKIFSFVTEKTQTCAF